MRHLSILARLLPTPLLVQGSENEEGSLSRAEPMAEPPKPRILCIDDTADETEIRLLKNVLERAGYQVLATRNAHEAVEILRTNDVDLVLTEDVVPSMNGPSIAEKLKRLKPDVPVALYSGAWVPPPPDSIQADRFITKLVSIDELLCTIQELLTKATTRAAA